MAAASRPKKSNGGKGSIAEQLVDNGVDVLMGGGMQPLRPGDRRRTDALSLRPGRVQDYRALDDADALDAVTSLDDGPVLGLFTGQHDADVPATVATGPRRCRRPRRPSASPPTAATSRTSQR